MRNIPKVSIITPLYNSSRFLRETLESIIRQTYQNLEIILVNDASTDETHDLVQSFKDKRILYFLNEKNVGIAAARNLGLERATGDYIAFLDHDDISLPERIEKQVQLFLKDDNLGLCGTAVRTFGDSKDQLWSYPVEPDFLRARLLFDCPFAASSVMVNGTAFKSEVEGFNTKIQGVDDYEMWVRISQKWKITNLPDVLTLYRVQQHQYSSSVAYKRDLTEMVWGVQTSLLRDLGVTPSENQKNNHLDMGVRWSFNGDSRQISESAEWLKLLHDANERSHFFEPNAFKKVLLERWKLVFGGYQGSSMEALRLYCTTPASRWDNHYYKKSISMLLNVIIDLMRNKKQHPDAVSHRKS